MSPQLSRRADPGAVLTTPASWVHSRSRLARAILVSHAAPLGNAGSPSALQFPAQVLAQAGTLNGAGDRRAHEGPRRGGTGGHAASWPSPTGVPWHHSPLLLVQSLSEVGSLLPARFSPLRLSGSARGPSLHRL
ncbi:hypothetical protein NDU88_005153 [Pleurodeles waltl]|uniref:Uncharacterized protein n=1 Tax=Pleurodeles waltl TaxID=8319 RepID=A0AAV7T9N1_PLEWA|nr:hypothetical protein NDU88_005153 [Pleurodeles waltl]